MKLNSYAANASNIPPVAPAVPSVGYPSVGDPQSGVRATLVGDYWYYQVQQEIANLFTEAGLTPDAATLTQLTAAVRNVSGERLQVADAAALRLVDTAAGFGSALTLGALSAGDGGGGLWRWDAASTAADNTGTVILPTGHSGAGRWLRLYQDTINVKWFGAQGNGSTNDTAAITAALAAVPTGGTVYFPSGTYVSRRGLNSADPGDNIVADGVTICGEGRATIIRSYNANGLVTDDSGNDKYNVFQATGRTGIRISNLSFVGYGAPLSAYQCTDLVVDGITVDGLLDNTSHWLFTYAVYCYQCQNVKVVKSHFDNSYFGVYLTGTDGTRTHHVIVQTCSFDQSALAGGYKTNFPTGVYVCYADNVTVSGCSFKNIYSSVIGGTTATGMGYGVYEGDGACRSLTVSGNDFLFEGKGGRNAIAILTSKTKQAIVADNRVSGTYLKASAYTSDTTIAVTGNTILDGCIVSGSDSATALANVRVTIGQNAIAGGYSNLAGIHVLSEGAGVAVSVVGNSVKNSSHSGIYVYGRSAFPCVRPMIANNSITGTYYNGIRLEYCLGAAIIGNTVSDGNISNASSYNGAAIFFTSYSQGSLVINNTITNTPSGAGLFTYALANINNVGDRLYKDLLGINHFRGMTVGGYYQYFSSAPTNGIIDIAVGDFIARAPAAASAALGWYCTYTAAKLLTADASSASTTVTVASTTGLTAGDIVLLTKDTNPDDGDYFTATYWHADTIASVTNSTEFVLTTGIPAGDGTYSAGTALATIARFKAAATL